MAIVVRRGYFGQFDPTRLVAGEWAVVLGDDPSTDDGRAAYVCFGANMVKRVATYEDLLDWFADLKEDTIDDVIYDAMADIREEYGLIKDDTEDAETARVLAESLRETAEKQRAAAEEARSNAESLRESSETSRQALANDLQGKLDDGYFNGATFTPSVSDLGILSWSNDKGLPNPASKSIKGEKGNDGVVTQLAAGMYALSIVDTDLVVTYGSGADIPDLEIVDNNLVLNLD